MNHDDESEKNRVVPENPKGDIDLPKEDDEDNDDEDDSEVVVDPTEELPPRHHATKLVDLGGCPGILIG